MAPTIVVGELEMPIKVDCRRHDLLFFAARIGKELGFQLANRSYVAEIVKLCSEGAREVSRFLMSGGQAAIAELESVSSSEIEQLQTLARATSNGLQVEAS